MPQQLYELNFEKKQTIEVLIKRTNDHNV